MFESLFGKANPTRTWQSISEQPPAFDLDTSSLNGGKLGAQLESVSFLGPDEDRNAFRNGELRYYSKGLCVECSVPAYMITSFQIVFHDPDEQEYQPFMGRVIHNGDSIDLAGITSEQVVDEFGEYFWLDRDEDESIVFYEFEGREWQLEFDTTTKLKRLIVTNEPLMADAAQRKEYRVTKPWPPQF